MLREIALLKSENRELGNLVEKERTRSDIELRRDRLVEFQQNKIADLTRQVRKLQEKLRSGEHGTIAENQMASKFVMDLALLKPIKSFSSEGLEEAAAGSGVKPGDPVILLNASGGGASTARQLATFKPSMVITCTAMADQAEEVLIRHAIPVVKADSLPIKNLNGDFFISRKELESLIDRQRSLMKNKTKSLAEDTIKSYREF